MKRHIFRPLLVVLGCALLGACADDDYTELNKGETELALTADANDITLDEAAHAENALTLTWTSGTNHGTGNRITYKLELAEAGTGFANPYLVAEDMTQQYTWSSTVEALNTLLRNNFGVKADNHYAVEARVTATVAGIDDVQTATTTFNVASYEPVTTTLYVTGTATLGGTDLSLAEEMTRTDNGQFTYTGYMKAGTYKFITTLGEELPSYNRGDDGSLVLRTMADQPDNLFEITEDHDYTITLNLLGGTITTVQSDGVKPPYDAIWFIDGMDGYSFKPMTQDVLDPFLFRYGAEFNNEGDFKFATASGSWENNYKATQPDAPYTDSSVEFVKGFDPDNKWRLQSGELGKAYKICLDIRSGKERMLMAPFTPYENIWLVGDAAPGGWSLDDAVPMTKDASNPYVMTWTGTLNTGELKFTCDRISDWNGAWFMSATNGAAPTGQEEKALFIDKHSDDLKAQYLTVDIMNIDNKWKIEEAGTYKITLNQLTETITIAKQ